MSDLPLNSSTFDVPASSQAVDLPAGYPLMVSYIFPYTANQCRDNHDLFYSELVKLENERDTSAETERDQWQEVIDGVVDMYSGLFPMDKDAPRQPLPTILDMPELYAGIGAHG